jgi:subtilisin-like proprotein convertase family protein
MRIGIERPLQMEIVDGRWNDLGTVGGRWTISVTADGAVGIRLHFSDFDLPEGASVRLVSPLRTEAVDGPFDRRGPAGEGSFWSTVLVGETAYLEYHHPAGGTSPLAELPFVVDRIQHIYRDPLLATGQPREGDCHNDVTCHPAWSDVRDAVARFTYVEGANSFVCSGELLDTVAGDQTPYFLAAAHCVTTQIVARSMVFYWKYQTAVCQGVPPDILTVPTSSLGSLVAGDPANDLALVMVIGELPPDVFWVGWDANPVANGTACSSIHHPNGEYKRISFGAKTGEQDGLIRVDWSSGVTEPGSSGAGAYKDATRQLFGSLYGGPSSCTAPPQDRYDLFGSFEYGYPVLGPSLQAGSDDAWEPNGACSAAPPVPPGTYAGLIVKSTDDDWYRLSSTSCGDLGVTLRFTDAYGDIDMELYDACNGGLLAESRGAGNTESLSLTPGVSGEYWLRIFLNSSTRNSYDMTVTLDGVNALYPAAPALPIPDNNPAGIEHSIFVPDHFTLADLDVGLIVGHTWNGDLRVRLTHGATQVWLIDRPGHPSLTFGYNNDGFDIILNDAAAQAIESSSSGGPTVTGSFRPNEPLAAFNGQDVFGAWTIWIADVQAQDIGVLKEWALYATQLPPTGEPCECGGDGDITGDGDADLAELAAMQRCFTGSGSASAPAGCAGLNFDCDSDVDLADVEYLIGVLTGPSPGGMSIDPPESDGISPPGPPGDAGPPAGVMN